MDIHLIHSKKVFIFDVDGTLYSQPKMRLSMAFRLLLHYGLHIWKVKELLSIYYFRKIREDEEFQSITMDEQISAAAQKAGVDVQKAKDAITLWMFEAPLDIIKKCSFESVLEFIHQMQEDGKEVVIYSDYPANEKLQTLGLNPSRIFTPENPEIAELKPSKKAMIYIMKEIGCSSKEIVYIGDRDEKDRVSADYSEIDYCDIRDLLRLLK